MTKKMINGEVFDMTPEEIAQAEADVITTNNIKAQEQAKEDLKASAKAKLIAGEALTEDEANTIVL